MWWVKYLIKTAGARNREDNRETIGGYQGNNSGLSGKEQVEKERK